MWHHLKGGGSHYENECTYEPTRNVNKLFLLLNSRWTIVLCRKPKEGEKNK